MTEPLALARLREFLGRQGRLLVITGAGCSTGSGIGDYRDAAGNWKLAPPVQYADFVGSAAGRRRYWARSIIGWPQFAAARPNAAHLALAQLEVADRCVGLITQNVDRLHQAAGQHNVLDLHGRLDRVRCLECAALQSRASVQEWLEDHNAAYLADRSATLAWRPDGDAEVAQVPADFRVPSCRACGGVVKPDVVFYGESVPKSSVARAYSWLDDASGVLVVGSSLMVFSSFRFARAAHAAGKPIAIVNRGVTRADPLAELRLDADCGPLLTALLAGMVAELDR